MLIRDYKTNESTGKEMSQDSNSQFLLLFSTLRLPPKKLMLISTIKVSIRNLLTRSDSTLGIKVLFEPVPPPALVLPLASGPFPGPPSLLSTCQDFRLLVLLHSTLLVLCPLDFCSSAQVYSIARLWHMITCL